MITTMTINDQLVELGTLVDNEDKLIQQRGAALVNLFFILFDTEPDTNKAAEVLYYLTDIQVRDYALGIMPNHENAQEVLAYLLENAPTDTIYINAPATLLAQYYYEQGNTADAFLTLTNAQPDYSLALLLDRVFRSGWNPKEFDKMRQALHPQVVKNIFGEEEE